MSPQAHHSGVCGDIPNERQAGTSTRPYGVIQSKYGPPVSPQSSGPSARSAGRDLPFRSSVSSASLKDLALLLAVCEFGSFRRAGVNLSRAQSSISRRIQRIEDDLGVSIFERSTAGASLTAAGEAFVLEVRTLFTSLDAAVSAARLAGEGQRGRLRVGMLGSLSRGIVRDIVDRFISEHREVELSFVEAARSELISGLTQRTLDVLAMPGEAPSTQNDSLFLSWEPVFLAVSTRHELARRDQLRWPDIADQTFLISEHGAGPEIANFVVRMLSDVDCSPRIDFFRIPRADIFNLVGLGMGVTPVVDQCLGCSYPDVAFVPLLSRTDQNEQIPFSLIWRPENDNPALRRFLSLARIEVKRNGSLSAPSRTPDPSP
ncbi:LysR family transcriptional regulator [bacterium]|nr:LysR family transcriptional regulator [bacterium]